MRISAHNLHAAQLQELCDRAEKSGQRCGLEGDALIAYAGRRTRAYAAYFERLTGLQSPQLDNLLYREFVAGAHRRGAAA